MGFWEWVIFGAYCVLGPGVWGVLAFGVTHGRLAMALLPGRGEGAGDANLDGPLVTVLIPAKDEGERITSCLEAAAGQTYRNVEIIAIDDRSGDGTGEAMEKAAAQEGRMRVVHIKELPAGWAGKNHALWEAVQGARGEWLLFVDSDVLLRPEALGVTMKRALRQGYDLFSLLPRLEAESFWERVMMPIGGAALTTMQLVSLANKDYLPREAFANGQFILVRKSVYDEIGGHAALKTYLNEDIEMARRVKAAGHKTRVAWGAEYASVRMYSSLRGIMRGFERNYYASNVGRIRRIAAALFVLMVCTPAVIAAAVWGWCGGGAGFPMWRNPWLVAAGVQAGIMVVLVMMIYRWSGNRARYAALLPISLGILTYIYVRALRLCFTHRLEWRGTAYTRAHSAG